MSDHWPDETTGSKAARDNRVQMQNERRKADWHQRLVIWLTNSGSDRLANYIYRSEAKAVQKIADRLRHFGEPKEANMLDIVAKSLKNKTR